MRVRAEGGINRFNGHSKKTVKELVVLAFDLLLIVWAETGLLLQCCYSSNVGCFEAPCTL